MIVVGLRDELVSTFERLPHVQFVSNLDEIEFPTDEQIFVDGASVEASTLSQYPGIASSIYLVSQKTATTIAVAQELNIRLITLDEIDTVFTSMALRDPSVITFWGTYPQLGTTTIAASVGAYLVAHYGVRVAMLQLNLYSPGTWILQNATHYLDDIKPFLKNSQLKPEQLRNSMNILPNGLLYLAGNRNQTTAHRYSLDEIYHLIETAKKAFDLVILDVGSILNHAPAIQGLLSGMVYAVITDRLAAQQQFALHKQHVLNPIGIKSEDIFLIANRVHARNKNTLTAYAEATGTTALAMIPEMMPIARFAEQETDRLKGFLDEKTYRAEIKKIVESITVHHSFQEIAVSRR